jgi:uncharacterized protein (DUF2147 family)
MEYFGLRPVVVLNLRSPSCACFSISAKNRKVVHALWSHKKEDANRKKAEKIRRGGGGAGRRYHNDISSEPLNEGDDSENQQVSSKQFELYQRPSLGRGARWNI